MGVVVAFYKIYLMVIKNETFRVQRLDLAEECMWKVSNFQQIMQIWSIQLSAEYLIL